MTSRKFILTVLFMAIFAGNSALGWGIGAGELWTLAAVVLGYNAVNVAQKATATAEAMDPDWDLLDTLGVEMADDE